MGWWGGIISRGDLRYLFPSKERCEDDRWLTAELQGDPPPPCPKVTQYKTFRLIHHTVPCGEINRHRCRRNKPGSDIEEKAASCARWSFRKKKQQTGCEHLLFCLHKQKKRGCASWQRDVTTRLVQKWSCGTDEYEFSPKTKESQPRTIQCF